MRQLLWATILALGLALAGPSGRAQDEPPAPAQTAAGTASRPEPSARPPLPAREPPGILAQVFGGLPGWLSRMPADVGLIAVLGLGVMFGLVFVGFRRSRETYD